MAKILAVWAHPGSGVPVVKVCPAGDHDPLLRCEADVEFELEQSPGETDAAFAARLEQTAATYAALRAKELGAWRQRPVHRNATFAALAGKTLA